MVDRPSARCANGHVPAPGRAVPKYCTLCGAPMVATISHRARRNRLIVPGVVLLILLIGTGAYFGVSKLTDNSTTHTAVAAASSITFTTGQVAPAVTPSPPLASVSASALGSPTTSPTPNAADPAAVVRSYYAAINAGDYALAWALGGDNIEAGSYDAFVQGFATTVSDNLAVLSVVNDAVRIHLDATQTDGSHHYYVGTYTVHNGVIVKASVQQSAS
jgi:hypothetical protein